MSKPGRFNKTKQKAYVAAYLENLGVKAAARRATGIQQHTVEKWERDDPEFKVMLEACELEWFEKLKAAGIARAGKRSDTLLIFFLKSKFPEMYDDSIRRMHHEQKNFEANKDKFILPRIEVNIIPKSEVDYIDGSTVVGCGSDPRSDN